MKEIGTLEPAGLISNFNQYCSQPIVDSKRLVSSFSNKDVTLKQSQVEWIIGRHVTDKNDRVYVTNSLSKLTSSGYINEVIFAPVDSKTMLREAGGKEIRRSATHRGSKVLNIQMCSTTHGGGKALNIKMRSATHWGGKVLNIQMFR